MLWTWYGWLEGIWSLDANRVGFTVRPYPAVE